jgi:haloalkane dehalogenase
VLEAFVLALDLRDVTLVVHDLGGPVSFHVAATHAGRFRALAITESFGWPLSQENPKVARMLRLVGGRAFGAVNDATNLLIRLTSTSAGVGRHLSRAGRRAFREPHRDRRIRRTTPAMLRDAAEAEAFLRTVDAGLRNELRHLPVLLVYGSKSPTVREGFPERWKERFPNAPLVIVEGGHHFPMCDDPDAVAEAIRSWWGAVARNSV